jgi:hypothetical protein
MRNLGLQHLVAIATRFATSPALPSFITKGCCSAVALASP